MKTTSILSVCIFILLKLIQRDVFVNGSDDGKFHEIPFPGEITGPESIAFDCNGNGPYVGVSDGRVLKWQGSTWSEFAISSSNRNRSLCDGKSDPDLEPTCGRALGLKFNLVTCDLVIADAYFGLLTVGRSGGVATSLASSFNGIPFKLTNAFDIDEQTGIIYFTDSSKIFQRRRYFLSLATGDRTGRLLKYDPHSNQVSVLHEGLAFPNGVALSNDKSFLLISASGRFELLKFKLLDSKTQSPEIFAKLKRIPDNIKKNTKGEFWVALNSGRGAIRKLSPTSTLNCNEVEIESGEPNYLTQDPVGIKFDKDGNVLQFLNGNLNEQINSISEVEEYNGSFYFGSTVKSFVGILNM